MGFEINFNNCIKYEIILNSIDTMSVIKSTFYVLK
jgi:hypothetical protein